MLKALVVAKSAEDISCDIIPTLPLVTWFDIGISSASSLPIHTWSCHTPLTHKSDEEVFVLTEGCKFIIVSTNSIIRIECTGNECTFYLDTAEYFTAQVPLQIIFEVLKDYDFIRTHSSHLINVKHLKTFVHCNAFVTLTNSDAVPVSDGNNQSIIDFLNTQTIL